MDYIWIIFVLNLNYEYLYWLTDTIMLRTSLITISSITIF
jgi:hypothetical protein